MRQEGFLLAVGLLGLSGGAGFYAMGKMQAARSTEIGIAPRNADQHSIQHASSSGAEAVKSFYDRIGKDDWSGAFALLSPSFQGGRSVEDFKAGYATTKSVEVQIDDQGSNTVPLDMTAADEYSNGEKRTRKFAIVWTTVTDSAGRRLLDHAKVTVISDSNPSAAEKPVANAPTAADVDISTDGQSAHDKSGETVARKPPAVQALLEFTPSANSTQYPNEDIAALVENACGADDYVGSSDVPGDFATSPGAHGSTNVVWTLKCSHGPYGPRFSFNISQDGEYLRELDRDTCMATHDRAFREALNSLVSPHQSNSDEPEGVDCTEAY